MANQKMKTKRAAAKRFKVTDTGKLKRNKEKDYAIQLMAKEGTDKWLELKAE